MLFLRMFNDDLAHPQTQWEIPKVYLRDSGPCVLNKWWMVMMIWPRIPARWMWVPALISLWCIPGFSIDVPMVWYMLCIYIYTDVNAYTYLLNSVFFFADMRPCIHMYIYIISILVDGHSDKFVLCSQFKPFQSLPSAYKPAKLAPCYHPCRWLAQLQSVSYWHTHTYI